MPVSRDLASDIVVIAGGTSTMDALVFFFALVGIVQCKLVNLSCENVRTIIDGHNTRRLQLAKGNVPGQPAASKMHYLAWDTELANKAANWAAKEKYGHNPDRTIGSNRFKVGENIYQYSTTVQNYEFDLDVALESWFTEYKNYKFNPLQEKDFQRTKDDQIGHYTQMAWSDTTYVGCGMSIYKQGKWTRFFVVCNYGPTGNYLGNVPYKSGRRSGKLDCGTEDCKQIYGDKCNHLRRSY